MWPCSTIVVLGELFQAESKAQVCATIHEFLSNHISVVDDLSKCNMSIFVIATEYVF